MVPCPSLTLFGLGIHDLFVIVTFLRDYDADRKANFTVSVPYFVELFEQ